MRRITYASIKSTLNNLFNLSRTRIKVYTGATTDQFELNHHLAKIGKRGHPGCVIRRENIDSNEH